MDAKQIGLFLYDLRKEHGFTQKDVSNMCNVTAQAVSKWERGESIPDIEILEKLSLLYKVSINELLAGEKKEIIHDFSQRRKIFALILNVFVFLVFLFPYFYVSANLTFPGLENANITLKGYTIIFNGTGGVLVIITMIIFFILLSHLFINILVLLKLIPDHKNTMLYIQITTLFIFLIALIQLFVTSFYILPQLMLMFIMGVQFYLITESKQEGLLYYVDNINIKNIGISIATGTKSLFQNSWQITVSKIIYYLALLICILAGIYLSILTIIDLNKQFTYMDYGMVLLVIFYLLLTIFALILSYKFIYKKPSLVRALPAIILLSVPAFAYSISLIQEVVQYHDLTRNMLVLAILVAIGLFLFPITLFSTTISRTK